jgi:peptidoglycan hydrolase CwlO-like protein
MIRKIVYRTIIVLLLVSFLLPFIEPKAANKNTLGYYEEKLAQYKREMQENKNAINKTQSEINSSQNKIEQLKNETLSLTNEVKKLNEEIDKYQGDIKDKLVESKQILEYMQISNDKNVYLDYVFKADSVTDLINRGYVVKELVDYNTKVVKELEQMISDNENRQKEIDKRKVKISETESQLSENIVELGEKKESLSAGGINIEKQIKIYDELVTMYKKKGCKTNDVIGVDCAVTGGSSVFRRPTKTGYITQEAYYKTSYSHRAVDIGSKNGRKEKIYPIADGTITSKYYDNYGALCLAIEHYNLKDRKYYTSLYVGKKVTSDQYIGYMGDTGYAFGVHLHMEVFPCRLYNPSDSNCYKWSVYDAYAKRLLRSGYNPRNLIAFPKGTYNSWSTR